MREILFRGKREKDEQWEYGAFWQSNSSIIDKSGYSQKVIPETVGQYTGLTDKNGKKIFEGDIVRFSVKYTDRTVTFNGEAKWSSYGFYIAANEPGGMVNRILGHVAEKSEIVGNIYDNPELLKDGEEYA